MGHHLNNKVVLQLKQTPCPQPTPASAATTQHLIRPNPLQPTLVLHKPPSEKTDQSTSTQEDPRRWTSEKNGKRQRSTSPGPEEERKRQKTLAPCPDTSRCNKRSLHEPLSSEGQVKRQRNSPAPTSNTMPAENKDRPPKSCLDTRQKPNHGECQALTAEQEKRRLLWKHSALNWKPSQSRPAETTRKRPRSDSPDPEPETKTLRTSSPCVKDSNIQSRDDKVGGRSLPPCAQRTNGEGRGSPKRRTSLTVTEVSPTRHMSSVSHQSSPHTCSPKKDVNL